MKPVRVLHVLDSLSNGGTETLIMDIYRNIDREKIQFDFLIRRQVNLYEKEINDLGGNVYITSPFPNKVFKNYKETKQVLNEKMYSIIHVHGNSLIYITPLIISKQMGTPVIIMHSHSTKTSSNIYHPIHKLNRLNINNLSTNNLACSRDAGKWMFSDSNFTVLKNGIKVNKFIYNLSYRKEIQKEFNLSDKDVIIGHVGRFVKSKNHNFLIDVFSETLKRKSNIKLILVGSGELEEKIKQKVIDLNIQDRVIFAGARNDIHKLMSSFDIFLFPSIFEGLGIVLIEAQASGLKCLTSKTIPEETAITNLVNQESLEKRPEAWADSLVKMIAPYERKNMHEEITCAGYNIRDVANELKKYYLNSLN